MEAAPLWYTYGSMATTVGGGRMSEHQMVLAAFDLDGTLLRGEIVCELKDAQQRFNRLPDDEKTKYKFVADMESDQEIMERFTGSLKDIAQENPGKNALVVSHSGLMRTFLIQQHYAKYGEIRGGSVAYAAYIPVSSDGNEVSIDEVVGVTKEDAKAETDHTLPAFGKHGEGDQ
jgi:broad specificity phosphatase PhoE